LPSSLWEKCSLAQHRAAVLKAVFGYTGWVSLV
jgi:hypothetical protein